MSAYTFHRPLINFDDYLDHNDKGYTEDAPSGNFGIQVHSI